MFKALRTRPRPCHWGAAVPLGNTVLWSRGIAQLTPSYNSTCLHRFTMFRQQLGHAIHRGHQHGVWCATLTAKHTPDECRPCRHAATGEETQVVCKAQCSTQQTHHNHTDKPSPHHPMLCDHPSTIENLTGHHTYTMDTHHQPLSCTHAAVALHCSSRTAVKSCLMLSASRHFSARPTLLLTE
jgi:hypothetical protein